MRPEDYLDAILSLPELYSPQVSSNAKYVAWTWSQVGPAADVFYAPTDGSTAPIQLSKTKQDTWLMSWSTDNNSVIVAQDRDGDERYRLYQINLTKPRDMKPLIETNPKYFLRGGQLHPNGQWLVYAANYDFDSRKETESTYIFRHDLNSGLRVRLNSPENPAYYVPHMNQQGSHILYSRKDIHPAGRQVWMVDIQGKEDREILNFGEEVKTFARWFPDGERVVVLSEVENYRRIGIWNRRTDVLVWLLDDPGRNIEEAYVPPNSHLIVLLEVKDARIQPSLLDPTTNHEFQLPKHAFNCIPLAPIRGDQWISQVYNSTQPKDLSVINLFDPSPDISHGVTQIWERTSLKREDLTPAEDLRWTTKDVMEVQGWLYRTPHDARGTIVTVHGGPTWHSQDKVDSEIQFLVSQGFNVLDPNYRGSTGFGLPFQEAIKVDGWGGREQDDIIAGVDKLLSLGVARDRKVGIMGTSYGGYSAWCAITRNSVDVIAAAAPICGMTDLVVDYETTRPDLRPLSEEMIGGSPEQIPEKYYERSPINFVKNIQGKLLIVQGLQDPNVTPKNVKEVETALKEAGVPYELLVFKDEGHGIFRPKNLKKLYLRLVDFFSKAFGS
jgi:dipeptidyl aminopeptidase/acylaminoacyl peptidase